MAKKSGCGEIVLKGLGAAPGIAVGSALVRASYIVEAPEYAVAKANLGAEQKRLAHAVDIAKRQVRALQSRARKVPGAAGEEMSILFDAYLAMLGDSRLVRGAHARIADRHQNAEAAVQGELANISEQFHAMEDAYLAARLDDIREVSNRLLRNLLRAPAKRTVKPTKDSIVVTDLLTPADMALIDPKRVLGVLAQLGGRAGHAAIMARALGLPAVMGVADVLDKVRPGDTVIVDGHAGVVVVNPSPQTLERYAKKREDTRRRARTLDRLRNEPAVSRDGIDVSLQANVELPIEMEMVAAAGAEGVGLLRTEFMFMNRGDIPSEAEQTRALRVIVEAMHGRPVTIRTLDAGAEKPVPALLGILDEAATTQLGLRGIRLSLKLIETLETQFRAILRVAASAHGGGNVRILLPMVSTPGEVRKAKALLAETAMCLASEGVKVPAKLPPVGIMIEVPGAALAADSLAQASDFFAIGSNDLTMYTLAVDRGNEHVAHLFDTLHPAVLRLIQFATQAALRARIPVSICGEIAGDARYTALLIGLGLRDFSMAAANIPKVKSRILGMDVLAATQRANLIMEQTDSGRIATLIDDFNSLA
ncbi:MAG: phosphoenolpyruvate--protein phosphotransferase [Proteobacteria bacterium]|nr:phosphoenolpyruvate--protein phosphotransferase [Pseudomonadota bacterium]